MKLTASAILFLVVGTLTEAHNIRIGTRHHEVNTKHHHEVKHERTNRHHDDVVKKKEGSHHQHDSAIPKLSSSSCSHNSHCSATGERCIIHDDVTNGGYCGPKAAFGEDCDFEQDCISNVCTYLWGRGGDDEVTSKCGECGYNVDCDGHANGPRCVHDPAAIEPPACGPKASIGEPCNVGDDCSSNRCVHDYTTYMNPPVCGPKLAYGETCNNDEDCTSTICEYIYSTTDLPAILKCADCQDNWDCDGHAKGPRCLYSYANSNMNPSTCAPKGSTGEYCFYDDDCVSNTCGDWSCR